MTKYLPWILLIVGAIVVYLLWPSDPEPPNIQPWKDSLARREAELIILRQREPLYQDTIRALDSARAAETQKFQVTITRLNRKLTAIDTRTASAAELDSIINELYNDAP